MNPRHPVIGWRPEYAVRNSLLTPRGDDVISGVYTIHIYIYI